MTLDATDTGTLGLLRLAVFESGALPVWEDFMVVTANVYDSLFSTDVLDVSVTQVNGTAAPNLVGGRFDASVGAMAAGVITAAAHAPAPSMPPPSPQMPSGPASWRPTPRTKSPTPCWTAPTPSKPA